MRIDQDKKLDFDDVLIRPKRSTLSSRAQVSLIRNLTFYHSPKQWAGIPICSANMDSSGTFEMAQELSRHKMLTILHKFYTLDELKKKLPLLNQPDYVAFCTGIRDEDVSQLQTVIQLGLEKYFSFICLDVPNAYLERVVQRVRELRVLLPEHIIIAGNVVTNEMTEELILAGADIVKIGIGSGSTCLTRKKTGVGYPQLSAIIESADAAHGLKSSTGVGLIMADGGIRTPGDIAKAFGAGADFILSGTLFAGFTESGGEIVIKNGKQYKEHFGSSSDTAMIRHYGSIAAHRASEGRTTLVPYKGNVSVFIQDVLGSLRSTATYIGAKELKEFTKRTTFILVNRQLSTALEQYDVANQ